MSDKLQVLLAWLTERLVYYSEEYVRHVKEKGDLTLCSESDKWNRIALQARCDQIDGFMTVVKQIIRESSAIIEHDGKEIDISKPMRIVGTGLQAKYGMQTKSGNHLVEYQVQAKDGPIWTSRLMTVEDLVNNFENIPEKHEAWFVVMPKHGHATKEEAELELEGKMKTVGLRDLVVIKGEWEA